MRRIEAITVSAEGPVFEAVLRLGAVTVLTGPNDSGKTRLLLAIAEGLASADWELRIGVQVHTFGIASQTEIDACRVEEEDDEGTGIAWAEVDAASRFEAEVALPVDPGEVRLAALSAFGDVLFGWRYGRALSELEPAVGSAIERELQLGGLDKEPDEPLALEVLGRFDDELLPEAILVPRDARAVMLRVAAAVTGLTRALRALAHGWRQVAGMAGPLADGPPDDWFTDPPRGLASEIEPSWEWLLKESYESNTSQVHPAAEHACAAISRMLVLLTPGFISDDYKIRVAAGRPSDIAQGRYLNIELARRRPVDEDLVESLEEWFDVAEAASGFNVWIQLALHEAVHRVRHFTYAIQRYVLAVRLVNEAGSSRVADITDDHDEDASGIPPDEDITEYLERVLQRFDGLGLSKLKEDLQDLLAGLADPRRPIPGAPDPSIMPELDEEDLTLLVEWAGEVPEPVPRGRVYLLDEPEQRLHPVLQRRAARWLGALMSEWGAQCVLATHSVAFMDLPGDTRVYEVTRSDEVAEVAPLQTASLTPYSQLAREMGLDRGELLTRTSAFLITATPIAALLEEMCAERLADARIALIAVDPGRQRDEILASALLSSLTAVPLVVLLTTISIADVQELQHATAAQRTQARAADGERGIVADLVELSVRHERTVEVLTLEVASILELFDKGAMQDIAHGPRVFPGHHAARKSHPGFDGTYEAFLASTYGLRADEQTIRAVARRMRDSGRPVPVVLSDAVWRVEQLTLAG